MIESFDVVTLKRGVEVSGKFEPVDDWRFCGNITHVDVLMSVNSCLYGLFLETYICSCSSLELAVFCYVILIIFVTDVIDWFPDS